jgi:hypothetical protein
MPASISDIGWDDGIKCQALYLDLQQQLEQNEFVCLSLHLRTKEIKTETLLIRSLSEKGE